MINEDTIRLVVGLHGWNVVLRRLHPENAVYAVLIYRHSRRHHRWHCLGLLGEVQQMSIEELVTLILTYADLD